ncbi:MAG: WD40 repeat domain-containing protein [Crocosphaera sp.]|nr:WD40 repeat domain-containing protein [Crocosphaera sp.]
MFHFGPNDAEYFFGRDIFIEEIYSAIETRHFLPILGASGSGKSSVVFAGLVPKLQQEGHWLFTHFRPGSDPFHALSLALIAIYAPNLNETEVIIQSRQLSTSLSQGRIALTDIFTQIQNNYPNQRLLLITDQFEELYTLCDDLKIQQNFLNVLISNFSQDKNISLSSLSNLSPVLVTTMRADFLGNALSYPDFGDLLRKNDTKIRSMNRQELTEVIEKPAHKLGVIFESGLVDRILDDIESQPGNLPLLEFALTELWNQRTSKQLTHEIYEKIGQVQGALARHADEKYKKLTEVEKKKVRHIFVQLVRPGEGTEDTRRIAIKEELGAENWSLVKQLADARLVVTSRNKTEQETVEVVHEALIKNWGELQQWMKTDRVFRAWQERLRAAKKLWEATNKDKGSLLRGAALAEAEERLKERPDQLLAEKVFIEESIKEENHIKKRNKLITGSIVIGSLLAVIVSSSLGLMARYQTKQAKLNLADSMAQTSMILFNEEEELDGLVEGIKAGKILQKYGEKDPEVLKALMTNIYKGTESNVLESNDKMPIRQVVFSPDKQILASINHRGSVRIWNFHTGEEVELPPHASDFIDPGDTFHYDLLIPNKLSFSADGKTLYSFVSSARKYIIWNVETGKEIPIISPDYSSSKKRVWNSNPGEHEDINYGHIIAYDYVDTDHTIKIWNFQTGKEVSIINYDKDQKLSSMEFSQDGKILASISDSGIIELWDVTTGKKLQTLIREDKKISMIQFSPDQKMLASISSDGSIELWDIEKGEKLHNFSGDDQEIKIVPKWSYSENKRQIKFSHNNEIIASIGGKTIQLWNVKTKKKMHTIVSKDKSFIDASFSPDNQRLTSVQDDNTIQVWSLPTGEKIRTIASNDQEENQLTSDGNIFVSIIHNTIKLRDVRTQEKNLNTYKNPGFISHNGQTWASINFDDQTIDIGDVNTGKTLNTIPYKDKKISDLHLRLSPNGQSLAFIDNDNKEINIWNTQTGQNVRTLTGHDNKITTFSWSPDNYTVAGGSSDDQLINIWTLKLGDKTPFPLVIYDDEMTDISFSPDGQALASSSANVSLWNTFLLAENVEGIKGLGSMQGRSSQDLPPHILVSDAIYLSQGIDIPHIVAQLQVGFLSFLSHENAVRTVSFSPDSQILASGGDDGIIKLWDINTQRSIKTFVGHQNIVTSVNFSPDGKILVSGSDDNTIKLWDIETEQEIVTLFGNDRWIADISFSSDGQSLLSRNATGVVKHWDMSIDSLLQLGCDRIRNYLKYNRTVKEEDRRICDDIK